MRESFLPTIEKMDQCINKEGQSKENIAYLEGLKKILLAMESCSSVFEEFDGDSTRVIH